MMRRLPAAFWMYLVIAAMAVAATIAWATHDDIGGNHVLASFLIGMTFYAIIGRMTSILLRERDDG